MSVGAGNVEGNGSSAYPVVSANDFFIAFYSAASNLVVPDTNNHVIDVFLALNPFVADQ